MNVICGKYDKHGKGPNRERLMNIYKLLGIPLFTLFFYNIYGYRDVDY